MSRYVELLSKGGNTWLTPPPKHAVNRLPTKNQPYALPGPPHLPEEPEADWFRLWDTVRKHWRLSAAFATSVMVAVTLVTFLMKPLYSPVARVEIDPPGSEMFTMEGRAGSDNPAEYMETQARNMQSDQLLIAVMRQLHLENVPELTQSGLVSRTISTVLYPVEQMPRWLWGSKKKESYASSTKDLQVLSSREATVFSSMQSRVSVKRDTASRLISVSFTSHDPVLSATVTNTLVRSFIERTYQTRHAAIMESTAWLSRQLDDIRAKMEQSNRELADFQSRTGIADLDQGRSTFTDQLSELNRQKAQAQLDRIQIDSFMRRIRSGDTATLPQIQSSLVIQDLTRKLGETRAELAQTTVIYGKNHPNVKKLQNQVEELQSQIRLQQSAIVGQMLTSYSAAISREQMIDAQIRGTARDIGQAAQYQTLKKEAQANADLYNALYARVKEAGITAASKSINIRIVDEARVLDSPTKPKPLVNFGMGLLVAVVGGLLLAFGREALDNRVHTPEDVQRWIGIAAVSTVPAAIAENRRRQLSALGLNGKRMSLEGPAQFLLEQPYSEQSEAIRGLHTSVMLCCPENPPQAILVVSSIPGEGKSTVAINLAMALAKHGNTCIVDADLRRSCLARSFGLGAAAGVSDYLVDSVALESIFSKPHGIQNLTVVTSGRSVEDPANVVASEAMRAFILSLRGLYEYVVIDSPPILPYADGRALAPFMDGVVFVCRSGMVTRDAMMRSMQLLTDVHSAPILEVVLNGVQTDSHSYGYSYRYK